MPRRRLPASTRPPVSGLGTLFLQRLSSIRYRYLYLFLGPTSAHLRHEFALLISSSLLTAASLLSLYRNSFGTQGDLRLVALTSAWLSRHLLLRLLCTTDRSTSTSPSLRGLAAQVLGRYCAAGQYFDPPPKVAGGGGRGGGALVDDVSGSIGLGRFQRQSAILYVWVILPASAAFGRLSGAATALGRVARSVSKCGRRWKGSADRDEGEAGGGGGISGSGWSSSLAGGGSDAASSSLLQSSSGGRASGPASFLERAVRSSALYRNLDYYYRYVPPAQLCVLALTFLSIFWGVLYYRSSDATRRMVHGPSAGFPGGGGSFHQHDSLDRFPHMKHYQNPRGSVQQQMHPGQIPNRVGPNPSDQFAGGGRYWSGDGSGGVGGWLWGAPFPPGQEGKPSSWQVLFNLAWIGTLMSLVVYARVLPPIPDLVSGISVPEAIRAEAKRAGGTGTGGGSSKSSRTSGGRGVHHHHRHSEGPWAEEVRAAGSENRFRLHGKVALLRVAENIILCSVLPQSEFACVATGHCSGGPNLWELPGLTGVTGRVNLGMYESLIRDRTVSFIVGLTVVVVTASLLLAQAATLDRTYLSTLSYVSSGDFNMDSAGSSSAGGSGRSSGRYRKSGGGGDSNLSSSLVGGGEGVRQYSLYLRTAHALFRDEVGHPSTSRAISIASKVLGLHVVILFCTIGVYFFSGYDCLALLLTLVAALYVTEAVVVVGMMDYGELQGIAEQISWPLRPQKIKDS